MGTEDAKKGELMDKIISARLLIIVGLILGSYKVNLGSEAVLTADQVETLARTKAAIGVDFQKKDLRKIDFSGCKVKGCNFSQADLPLLDIDSFDWYVANFDAAKIPNYSLLKKKLSTFGLHGRIDVIEADGEKISCNALNAQDIGRYKLSTWKTGSKFVLAYLYETFGSREDEETAFELYKQALQNGLHEAANNLGWLCEHKRGTSIKTIEQALKYYEKASAAGIQKGKFNHARLDAKCHQNPDTFYLVGKMFMRGEGIELDEECAYCYFLLAAEAGLPRAMCKVGAYLKAGTTFLKKNTADAIDWLVRADKKDEPEASGFLGDMYYYGDGVIGKDLAKAFAYRKKAAGYGNKQALKDLAWMTERGEGIVRNPEEALTLYSRIAKSEKSVSAYYAAAKLCDELKKDEEAVQFYIQAIERTHERFDAVDSHGGREHIGALYRLGCRYHHGKGTEQNLEHAKNLFLRAAKFGHLPSRIKLHFLQRPDALIPFEEFGDLSPEAQLLFLQASDHLIEEVDAEHPIHTRTLNLPLTLVRNAIVMNVEEMYNLTNDYHNAQEVVKAVAKAREADQIQVNYSFISADPYLKYFYADPAAGITENEISAEAIEALFDELKAAAAAHESYEESMEESLEDMKDKLLQNSEKTKMVRKKLLYRYRKMTTPEADEQWSDEQLRAKKGAAAISFVQNSDRCADGLGDYLADLESQELFGSTQESLPLGARLSKIISKYKSDFLEWHKTNVAAAVEEKVEAMALLRERMRMPLGLPGTFTPPLYPALGHGDSVVYDPVHVMERFLTGGVIPQRQHIAAINPYTPQFLIDLIKKAVHDPNNHMIERAHLNALSKHPKFKTAFEQAFIMDEPNEYFDPLAPSNEGVFKDLFFRDLLLMHGYLIKKS